MASSTTTYLPQRKGRKGVKERGISKVKKMPLSGRITVETTVFGIRQTWIQILICHLIVR